MVQPGHSWSSPGLQPLWKQICSAPALDEPDAALLDAKKAVKLKGTWPKGYYRYTGTPLLHISYGQVSGLVHRFLLL